MISKYTHVICIVLYNRRFWICPGSVYGTYEAVRFKVHSVISFSSSFFSNSNSAFYVLPYFLLVVALYLFLKAWEYGNIYIIYMEVDEGQKSGTRVLIHRKKIRIALRIKKKGTWIVFQVSEQTLKKTMEWPSGKAFKFSSANQPLSNQLSLATTTNFRKMRQFIHNSLGNARSFKKSWPYHDQIQIIMLVGIKTAKLKQRIQLLMLHLWQFD